MGDTAIEWSDMVWNPLAGCTRVSPGCQRCYAERLAHRLAAMGQAKYAGLTRKVGDEVRWTGEVRLDESALTLPLSWKKPRRVFVNSMSDLFHEKVPDEWIDRIFAVMALTVHTFQVLTKRPERMRAYMNTADRRERVADACPAGYTMRFQGAVIHRWPPLNVWLGVSVEDQAAADARIPLLLQTPAAVRFLSVEPLLGPVDLTPWRLNRACLGCMPDGALCAGHAYGPRVDWVIVGCESGPGRRNQDEYEAHARDVIGQCRAAGVAVFHKQMPVNGRVSHDPAEWPDNLRVREFPR